VDRTPVWRPTARILVADPEGRVLLFSAREADGERWWFTPGGGVHRGETVLAAAVRELFEETGYAATESELGPVVA
jgi:8-oxo-dGTP pyrophosphatase MutT (NUDIX family)